MQRISQLLQQHRHQRRLQHRHRNPLLRRAPAAKIASISSGLGSIERNLTGGIYGYRISKAGLNMATRSLAQDLRKDGIVAVALTPGWVKTDMGGAGAQTERSASVTGLVKVIRAATANDSGKFLNYRGETLPW